MTHADKTDAAARVEPARSRIARWRVRLSGFKIEQAAYLLIGVPMVLWLCYLTPLMQVPDEPNHLLRATQISQGQIVAFGSRNGHVGGFIDSGLMAALMRMPPALKRTTAAETMASEDAAKQASWSHEPIFAPFPNTAVYSPIFYAPQAVALAIARASDFDIAASVRLARIFNAVSALIIALLALGIARRGRTLLLVTSLLPMTLFQFASASQDALLIASSFLFFALISRAICDGRVLSWRSFIAAGLILVAVSLSRPPMFFLGGLLLLPGARVPVRRGLPEFCLRLVPVIAALFLLAAWSSLQANIGGIPSSGGEATAETPWDRAFYLVQNPVWAIGVGFRTLERFATYYYYSIIGFMGWTAVGFRSIVYRTFAILLVLALFFDRRSGRVSLGAGLGALTVVAALFIATHLVIYLIYAPIGTSFVRGVQGRYFLAFIPVAALCFSAPFTGKYKFGEAVRYAIIFTPAINFLVIPEAMDRFYYR